MRHLERLRLLPIVARFALLCMAANSPDMIIYYLLGLVNNYL